MCDITLIFPHHTMMWCDVPHRPAVAGRLGCRRIRRCLVVGAHHQVPVIIARRLAAAAAGAGAAAG